MCSTGGSCRAATEGEARTDLPLTRLEGASGIPLRSGLAASSAISDVLQAESIEAAQALVAGHPHFGFGPGCEVEVHEAMPIGM